MAFDDGDAHEWWWWWWVVTGQFPPKTMVGALSHRGYDQPERVRAEYAFLSATPPM